jgi:hypothetical protein
MHHVAAGHAGLPPGEARRDPPHQVIEQVLVRIMVYRGFSGCRVIVLFHKLAGSRQPRLLSRAFGHPLPACQVSVTLRLRQTVVTCSEATKITIYNCRISPFSCRSVAPL